MSIDALSLQATLPELKRAELKTMKLKDPLLLRELCFIDGGWVAADDGGTVAVKNPATGQGLGVIPNMGAAETRRAIAAAASALPAWAARTAKDAPMRCAVGST